MSSSVVINTNVFVNVLVYLQKSGYLFQYVLMLLVEALVTIAVSKTSSMIYASPADMGNVVILYICVETLNSIISSIWIDNLKAAIEETVKLHILNDGVAKYSTMSAEDLDKTQPQTVTSRMNNCISSTNSMLSYGIPTCFSLITSIFLCMQTILAANSYTLIVVIVTTYAISVKLFLRPIIIENSKSKESVIKENSKIETFVKWYMAKITKAGNVEKLAELNDETFKLAGKRGKVWHRLICAIEFTNQIILVVVCLYFRNDSSIIKLINTIKEFKRTSKSFILFLNNYQRIDANYAGWVDLWKNKKFNVKTVNVELPDIIGITNVAINVGKFSLVGGNLSINKGDIINIMGASGAGKSMFIRALLGFIEGVQLEENKCASYRHKITEFQRSLIPHINTHGLSIRTLFNKCKDDELIRTWLRVCSVGDLAEEKNFNSPINKLLSAGQTVRLALAMCMVDAIVNDASIIILDEVEQNSDIPVATKMIETIVDYCRTNKITVIAITHYVDQTVFNADQQWTVKDGTIYSA